MVKLVPIIKYKKTKLDKDYDKMKSAVKVYNITKLKDRIKDINKDYTFCLSTPYKQVYESIMNEENIDENDIRSVYILNELQQMDEVGLNELSDEKLISYKKGAGEESNKLRASLKDRRTAKGGLNSSKKRDASAKDTGKLNQRADGIKSASARISKRAGNDKKLSYTPSIHKSNPARSARVDALKGIYTKKESVENSLQEYKTSSLHNYISAASSDKGTRQNNLAKHSHKPSEKDKNVLKTGADIRLNGKKIQQRKDGIMKAAVRIRKRQGVDNVGVQKPQADAIKSKLRGNYEPGKKDK